MMEEVIRSRFRNSASTHTDTLPHCSTSTRFCPKPTHVAIVCVHPAPRFSRRSGFRTSRHVLLASDLYPRLVPLCVPALIRNRAASVHPSRNPRAHVYTCLAFTVAVLASHQSRLLVATIALSWSYCSLQLHYCPLARFCPPCCWGLGGGCHIHTVACFSGASGG